MFLPYNKNVKIEKDLLTLDTAIVSGQELIDLFLPALDRFKNYKKVLYLGLGGGTLPRYMWQKNGLLTGDAIELDRGMIDIYNRWGKLPRLTIHHMSALEYIKNCSTRYDLCICDIFQYHRCPAEFITTQFTENLKKVCKSFIWNAGLRTYNSILQLLQTQKGLRIHKSKIPLLCGLYI